MSTRWLLIGALSILGSLGPSLVLILARARIGRLSTASWLVVWGALIATGEHAFWAMSLAPDELFAHPHARVHYFMAGVYALVGGVLLSIVARTLLREGRRTGWFAVLFALLLGGGLEVLMNGPTGLIFQHGFSVEESRPEGMGLLGYLFAWAAALLIAYRPVFTARGELGPGTSAPTEPAADHVGQAG